MSTQLNVFLIRFSQKTTTARWHRDYQIDAYRRFKWRNNSQAHYCFDLIHMLFLFVFFGRLEPKVAAVIFGESERKPATLLIRVDNRKERERKTNLISPYFFFGTKQSFSSSLFFLSYRSRLLSAVSFGPTVRRSTILSSSSLFPLLWTFQNNK